jgi:hypothetical protein
MPQNLTLYGIVRIFSLAAFLLSVHVAPSLAAAPTSNGLTFSRYTIESESPADWTVLTSVDAESTASLFGLFVGKQNQTMKLMAFKFLEDGGKVCARERSRMNINQVKYEKIETPKGWDCVLHMKETSRVSAVRTFSIKGKSRSTVFSLVLVGESMPKERFMKAVKALKDVKR